MDPTHPSTTLFPYTTLFRSNYRVTPVVIGDITDAVRFHGAVGGVVATPGSADNDARRDRKSTRLNSSHSQISYAVFCLKKKKLEYATRTCSIVTTSLWLRR